MGYAPHSGRGSEISTHPLEHPLPLDRVLMRRAQELAHPPHHGAQLGGARGRAVGLCVLEPRGDRLGLEGGLVLRRMLRLRPSLRRRRRTPARARLTPWRRGSPFRSAYSGASRALRAPKKHRGRRTADAVRREVKTTTPLSRTRNLNITHHRTGNTAYRSRCAGLATRPRPYLPRSALYR